jgi:hypothetical protein
MGAMAPPASRRPLGPRSTAASVAAAALAVACGPSFQAIYEGNSRFERCYALEENPRASMREKADCWRDWSDHYTYGQTRDRIQYAIARYVALSQAPNVPTDEALMMAAPGVTPRVSTITAPAPTNAFEPPPKVLDEDAGGAAPPRPSEVPILVTAEELDSGVEVVAEARVPPGTGCASTCKAAFRACHEGCDDDAGTACVACDRSYRRCMRSCFR